MKRFYAILMVLFATALFAQSFPMMTDALDATAVRPLDRRWMVLIGGMGIDGFHHVLLTDSSGALLASSISLDPDTYEADTVMATYSTDDSTVHFSTRKDFVMISARESWDYAVGWW